MALNYFSLQCISLLGLLPAPFLYGYLIDQSCTLWDTHCGRQRNCLVYDTDLMRQLINGFTAACMLGATCCDFAVFVLGRNLKLYEQKGSREEEGYDSQEMNGRVANGTAKETL